MKLYRCDICGECFKPIFEGEFEGRNAVAVGFMTDHDIQTKNKTFDACPRCMSKIEELIETRQKYRVVKPMEEKK